MRRRLRLSKRKSKPRIRIQERMRRRGKERADKRDLKVGKVKLKMTKAIADKKMVNEAGVQKVKRAVVEKATGDG